MMHFHGPDGLCKAKWLFKNLVAYAAPYALVALSIDRVDAIVKPLRASTSKRGLQTLCIVSGAWLTSAIFSCPNLLWVGVTEHKAFGRQCSLRYAAENATRAQKQLFWRVHVTVNLVTMIIIPITIVALCHIVLIAKIFRSSRGPKVTQRSGNGCGRQDAPSSHAWNRSAVSRAKVKTVKVTCTIVSVFILCWLPFTIGNFLDVFKAAKVSLNTLIVIQTLGTLNSAANPIIFFIFNYNQCCRSAASAADRNNTAWYATTTRGARYQPTASTAAAADRRRSSCKSQNCRLQPSGCNRNRDLDLTPQQRRQLPYEMIPLTAAGVTATPAIAGSHESPHSNRTASDFAEEFFVMLDGEV